MTRWGGVAHSPKRGCMHVVHGGEGFAESADLTHVNMLAELYMGAGRYQETHELVRAQAEEWRHKQQQQVSAGEETDAAASTGWHRCLHMRAEEWRHEQQQQHQVTASEEAGAGGSRACRTAEARAQ